jgi:hypothetical protein
MAAPIKVTPVLSGASSKHFNASLKANNQKVPASEKSRIFSLVKKILSKNK